MKVISSNQRELIPFYTLLVLTVIFAVAYTVYSSNIEALTYLKLALVTPTPLIFPVISKRLGISAPIALNILFTLHVFCSVHLGTCLSLYSRIPVWDLFLHGLFGAVACAFFVLLSDRTAYMAFLSVLSALGIGAAWEIFEFISDLITGKDAQGVRAALKNGTNPLSDTVSDLIITVVGSAVCLIFLYALRKKDKKRKKMQKRY